MLRLMPTRSNFFPLFSNTFNRKLFTSSVRRTSLVYPPGTSPVDVAMWSRSEKEKRPDESERIDTIAEECLREMDDWKARRIKTKQFADAVYQDALNTGKTAVPGLAIWKNYFSDHEQRRLQANLCKFREDILVYSRQAVLKKGRTYLSRQHNLESSEGYRLVHIGKQAFQYFEQYGEEGHSLTYAIGSKNIPEFVKADLISRILQLPEMEKYADATLEWNFTFNTYSVNSSNQLSGFPRHKDIPENGDVTFIYSLGNPSEFEIEDLKQSKVYRYPLLANSLLKMSDEARWDFLHAVVPQKIQGSPPILRKDDEHVEHRYSAVLGFHVK